MTDRRIAPRATMIGAVFLAVAVAHLAAGTDLEVSRMVALVLGAEPGAFADVQFTHAVLPRLAMALLCGAALGLAGSLFQQLTQNPLAAPLTLGAASGAWLALVIATLLLPTLATDRAEWVAFAGASLAYSLVVAISGLRGLIGLSAVLAGMAVNLLFGAIAATIVLLQSPYFGHLFVWGAGDLGQSGWDKVTWLTPRLLPLLVASFLLGRGLTLLRTGAEGAEARGLPLAPFLAVTAGLALGLTALAVAAVGLIGFIGLVAPNLARFAGARRPRAELLMSMGLGAGLLLATDLLAVLANQVTRDLVPSGAMTALVGAPALIWLMRRRLGAGDQAIYRLPPGPSRVAFVVWLGLAVAAVAMTLAALTVGRDEAGWQAAWPTMLTLELRWPRVLGAAAAGLAMALSGVILQRLIRNPLASPDIMGMTAGATFALVGTAILGGGSIHEAGAGTAILGSLLVLGLLLWLGRRHGHAPTVLALAGIALAALLDAFVKVALAAGSEDSYAIIGWLGGSTYRVTAREACQLALAALMGLGLVLLLRHWLTLLSAGDDTALARGLSLRLARPLCLTLAAALAALVTAWLGPVAFVGLLAPHAAVMLGGRRVAAQALVAGGIGAILMVGSDWLGRMALFPMQLPAGSVASVLGGGYFMYLLMRRKLL
ncbi:iron complex transport system permease protein [Roseovarius azorensis]|uniref:Iron complex transport system permease protein n=1 Tax=Roseovarius azorensis TaxID=1287727 RepID=A0A1H7M010_9RHOB|nr:Fe(3+)-hydroxamate ABC transporter permease FhuB [Roseovarius azorensis]SEL04328.1 iron complex transport system permease protein [Roseovarius azorensis]